jgi:uncharacterized membrane protein
MTPVPWILLGVGVLLGLTPKWTRPDLYFAVTVRPDFAYTAPARRILHRYWMEIALHTAIALGVAGFMGMDRPSAALLGIGWLMIGSGWAVARAHRATAAYAVAPSPVREATIPARRDRLPGGLAFALGPLALVVVTAVYAWMYWERLPERIPVHWGLQGADRWIERTPWNVAGFLAQLGCFCAVLFLLSYGTLRWSRTISAAGERAVREFRFRRLVLWLLIGAQYLAVVPGIALAFWVEPNTAPRWPIVSLIVITAAVILLVRMGQGGSHGGDRAEDEPPIGDRTPDTAWKWGLFYYNPDDPAVIVEKRFGLGYTINFGNRWSWVLIPLFLLPLALAMVVSS